VLDCLFVFTVIMKKCSL